MKTLLLLGLAGFGIALYTGVIEQDIVRVNKARAAEIVLSGKVAACDEALEQTLAAVKRGRLTKGQHELALYAASKCRPVYAAERASR